MENHAAHGQMSRQMASHHYKMLALNMAISLLIMYVVMFSMIWSAGEFINNLNMFYMALTMAAPMGILMLLMMRMMYPNPRLNMALYALFGLMFIVGLWGTRAQILVGDRQFVRAMIPHHSGAILMCERAALQDTELRDLCFKADGIVASQNREIAQMKAFLARGR